MRTLLLTTVFLLISFITFSQDKCSDILKDGIRDTYISNTSYYNNMALMIDISSMQYSEFKSNFGGGVTIPIKGIPFTGSMTSSEFNKSQQKLRKRLEYNNITKHKSDVYILAANSQIIYAWKECMKSEQGKFQSIVIPIDIEKGIYEYHYHFTYFPTSNPVFNGYMSDNNLIVKDPDKYLSKGKEIRPNAKTIVMLELKNPKESTTFTVKTSLGDKTFFIPGKKYLGPLELTEQSKSELIKKLKMAPVNSKRRSWNTPSQPHCTVEADEAMLPGELTINKTATILHYKFHCTRKNTRYECDGGWENVGDDSYNSSATADLSYRNGILYISNIKANEQGKDTECGDLIKKHLQSMSGMAIDLKFIEPDEK